MPRFETALMLKHTLLVTSGGAPNEQHLIFPSGWPNQYHVVSESNTNRATSHQLMTAMQIGESFGVAVMNESVKRLRIK